MSQYPYEVVRIMGNQVFQLRRVVGYWFARRHTTHNREGTHRWIAELRRIDRGSGYSEAVRECIAQGREMNFPHYRSQDANRKPI